MFLGIDTGGTFTDFVYFDGKQILFHKTLSTPDDPSRSILKGIEQLGIEPVQVDVVHGSTVATNAILERKGVKTLFVTNHGLEDILFIGRQTRAEIYDLSPEPAVPWIGPEDCIGLHGRVDTNGKFIEDCLPGEMEALGDKSDAYEAIACCTLFSFLNPEQELSIAAGIPAGKFLSLSHDILPEYREYERATATFLNAYVGPLTKRYLQRLSTRLGSRQLFIMHSAGGLMRTEQAGKEAVRMILSGPAGGMVAAKTVGEQLQESRLISFDMGGTSTDVALIDGEPRITIEGSIAGLPIAIPMLDIHTIGAGGGSIAWLDEAGILHVGPQSAGANPGPVCYGLGAKQITVTDANLVLGRIPATARMAGSMPLDMPAALQAMAELAEKANLDLEAMAEGIVKVAEENMAAALRLVSIQRGYDARRFSLVCFGGAGGLHACSLASKLGIRKVILPLASGAFSALGMMVGQQQGDYSRSRRLNISSAETTTTAGKIYSELEDQAATAMPGMKLKFEYFADLRFNGQGFQLTIPYTDDTDMLADAFMLEHQQAYGHILEDCDIEIMTLRLKASAETRPVVWPELQQATHSAQPDGNSGVYHAGKVPHYRREGLLPGHEIIGPALILEDTATIWLASGWRCSVSPCGHLLMDTI